MMYSRTRSMVSTFAAAAILLFVVAPAATAAQDDPPPQPIELECATDASVQVLKTTEVGDGSETLALVRVLFEPGGSLGAHNHPGTLAVTLESGLLEYTLLDDDETVITRAAGEDTEAEEETVGFDEPVTLEPGDSFIDSQKVHTAANLADEQTTVLIAGLVQTGEPITSCAEPATPAA